MHRSIGAIEFRSISKGIEVTDKMVKKADVELLFFKTICPGKFLTILSGNEGEVKEAIDEGVKDSKETIVDSFILNAVHLEIIEALKNRCKGHNKGAIGIMETANVCSGIQALDKTLKDTNASLLKLKLAFGIGGKLVYVISGEISDIENGMNLAQTIIEKKKIINISIIPSPDSQIISMLN